MPGDLDVRTRPFLRQPGETEQAWAERRRALFLAEYVNPILAGIEAHRAAGTLTPMSYRGDDPDYQRRRAKW